MDLFDYSHEEWPPAEQFPLNVPGQQRRVETLTALSENVRCIESIDRRIAAAILGVPE